MKKQIKIRHTMLGEGKPQICLPLTRSSASSLEAEIKWAVEEGVEVFEYRGDLAEGKSFSETGPETGPGAGPEAAPILETLSFVRDLIGDRVLIFTYRSKEEGGLGKADSKSYYDLNVAVGKSGLVDIVDVELDKGRELIERIISVLTESTFTETPVHLQLSKHFLKGGTNKDEIINTFIKMQSYPVSLTKVAVTAHHEKEALELMEASLDMRDVHGDRPFTAIAMGEKGIITRTAGGFLGSALIFAKGKEASAPGQPDVKTIKAIMNGR